MEPSYRQRVASDASVLCVWCDARVSVASCHECPHLLLIGLGDPPEEIVCESRPDWYPARPNEAAARPAIR